MGLRSLRVGLNCRRLGLKGFWTTERLERGIEMLGVGLERQRVGLSGWD